MTEPADGSVPVVAPQRLLEDLAVREIVGEYVARTRFGFGEERAWHALQRRRTRRIPARPWAAAVCVALAGLAVALWGARSPNRAPISAEVLPARETARTPSALSGRAAPEPSATTPLATGAVVRNIERVPPLAVSTPSRARESQAPALAVTSSPVSPPAEPAPSVLPRAAASAAAPMAPGPPQSQPDPCIAQQRAGHYQLALECFRQAAAGNGVGAELALYEQARLESAALGRPDAALRTLADHLRRFPTGALASEARLMRLGLLAQTGDGRALEEVERALSSPLAAERRGDLLLLRGNILKASARCADALLSYAQAEQAGISAARVERAARACQAGEH